GGQRRAQPRARHGRRHAVRQESMCHALDKHVESRATFKGGNLRTYRYCDSIWTLNLRNTTFMNEEIETVLPMVKIVAYDMRMIEEPVEPITCQQCQ
uniref:Transcription initiation factor IIA gamma subunit C-terminal domain-containing protein n=1 Tax=Aegilops tauschii subsp. strangulata TaxID=200361 RepID=A0A453GW93_AEGTS